VRTIREEYPVAIASGGYNPMGSGMTERLPHLRTRGQRPFTLAKLRTAFETLDKETSALRRFEYRPNA